MVYSHMPSFTAWSAGGHDGKCEVVNSKGHLILSHPISSSFCLIKSVFGPIGEVLVQRIYRCPI